MSWRGWIYWGSLGGGMVALVVGLVLRDGIVAAIGAAALLLGGYGVWVQRGPHPHQAWSPQPVPAGRAVVAWKDGCPSCHRLLRELGSNSRIAGVNVYRDAAADRAVRDANHGDQLTPTVWVGGRVLSNPSADEVRAALDSDGAH